MHWLKQCLPQKRGKRALLLAGATLTMALAADMALVQYWRHVRPAPETTVISSPLNAAGMPDYTGELNRLLRQGITAENNAAPLLFQIFGTRGCPEGWLESVMPALALPVEPLPSKFAPFENWMRLQPHPTTGEAAPGVESPEARIERDETAMRTLPWKQAAHPEWKQWLESQRETLTLAHEALQRPHYFVPLAARDGAGNPGALFNSLLPGLGDLRSLGNLLMADAMRCAGEGDFAGFRHDVSDVIKLSRLLTELPITIQQLVGYQMEIIAYEGIAALPRDLVAASAKEVAALRTELAAPPPSESGARSLSLGERWCFLDLICYAARYGVGQRMPNPWTGGSETTLRSRAYNLLVPIHFDADMREVNAHFDALDAAYKLPTHEQRVAGIEACETRWEQLKVKWLMNQLIPPGLASFQWVDLEMDRQRALDAQAVAIGCLTAVK